MSATGKQQVPGHHQPGAGEGFPGLAHHLGASGRETTPPSSWDPCHRAPQATRGHDSLKGLWRTSSQEAHDKIFHLLKSD